jgi:polyisoprenoid-binding protein YceI
MRATLASLAFASLVISSPALSKPWKIDGTHSSATFRVKHLMVATVQGSMSGIEGTVDLDEQDVTKSKVNATLDAATINTNEPKRDEHLRSPDFFNTAKHPKITFASKSVKAAGAGKLAVTGALTMNGVTKDVTLDVEGPTAAVKGMAGDQRCGLTATTTLNRKDFNINWNKALDGGGVVVGEDVKVTLDLSLSDAVKASH